VIEDALWTTTTWQIPETFQAVNRISLPKAVVSAGNVRKRNLKFKKYAF